MFHGNVSVSLRNLFPNFPQQRSMRRTAFAAAYSQHFFPLLLFIFRVRLGAFWGTTVSPLAERPILRLPNRLANSFWGSRAPSARLQNDRLKDILEGFEPTCEIVGVRVSNTSTSRIR